MSKRMRVRGWQVMPVIVADDGTDLVDVSVRPVMIPARDWQAFKGGGDRAALDQIRQQIELPEPSPKGEAVTESTQPVAGGDGQEPEPQEPQPIHGVGGVTLSQLTGGRDGE